MSDKPVCKVSETKHAVQEAVVANEQDTVKAASLPVTVLSGFLGAGKNPIKKAV